MAKTKIVFASGNEGKIQELISLLRDFPLDIIPQSLLQVSDAEETGLTFVENALIKARHACKATGLPAIADDSGLEVVALKGAPGIYSARYAGEKARSEDNVAKLLQALAHHTERKAYFHCLLVYLSHAEDPTPLICQGTWAGEILFSKTGAGGFGFDPIFYDPTQKCSAAELSLSAKNHISHRGKALRLLLKQLPEKLKYACAVSQKS